MGVPINNVPRRVVFAASGVGPYAFTFEILAAGDIAVFRDDLLLTLTTDYTVTINPDGTGSVTLVADPTGATQIAIVGNRTIQRISDFVTGGDFFANTLNDELDQQTIFNQQNAEGLARALQAPITDPTGIDMTLPRRADRAGKYLVFDTNGNPAPGEIPAEVNIVANNIGSVVAVANNATNINAVNANSANVTAVGGNISNVNAVASNLPNVNAVNSNATNINTVAGQITPTNRIQTVAGISSQITTVAGISSAVSTVAGISSNVTAVADNETNINNIAANIDDVQAIGPIAGGLSDIIDNIEAINNISDDLTGDDTIGTVATNLGAVQIVGSDLGGSGFDYDLGSITVPATGPSNTPDGFIQTVVNNLPDITDVADNINGTDTIGTVAGSIANVNAVGPNISNVNTVAGISANVTTVAGNSANVNTVAGISGNVTTVAGISSAVSTVATNDSNVSTVAGNISSVNTVAGVSSNVTTVAGISADVTTVAANVADITNFADVYQGPKTANPTLRNDGSALQAGDLYFNTVAPEMRVYTGTGWDAVSTNRTRDVFRYLATAGQTSFSGTDSNGNLMTYTAGSVDVFLNGVRLDQADFTATNGTTVVLTAAAALNDELNIVAFGTFDVANFNGAGLQDGTVSVAKLATTLDLGGIA